MMMKYRIIPVTPFQQNCTLIWCDETRKAAVVDPGGDLERIKAVIAEEGVTVEKILLTHAHIDHAGGTAALADDLNLTIEGPQQEDNFWIQGLPQQSQMFGFPKAEIFTPDRWLEDGDRVTVGKVELQVIHCPGHTPVTSCSTSRKPLSPWSETYCSTVPSAVPTSPRATMQP